ELDPDYELEADLGIDTVKQAEVVAVVRDRFRLDHDSLFRLSDYRTLRDLANYAARRLGSTQLSSLPAQGDWKAGLLESARPVSVPASPARAIATPSLALGDLQAELLSSLVEGATRAGIDGGGADAVARAVLPAVQALVQALVTSIPRPELEASTGHQAGADTESPIAEQRSSEFREPVLTSARNVVSIVCSGASLGLPGGDEVFASDNIERILEGESRIRQLTESEQDRFLAKRVVRLRKDARTGQGTFEPVERREEVIRLAGVKSSFDFEESYGVNPDLSRAFDVTTKLAIAAGVEALRDAGIPLVRTYRETTTGKRVATGWALPESMRDGTGIIFASAFPGYSKLVEHLLSNGDDGEGRFDRRFLFQILAMGHSQLAQFIGARGPNTQVNAACASTSQAISMAADWIAQGRADRVLVVGADDVTNETLLEWIGTGFLVSGAATTTAQVEEAALPFDRRRHGMILGMGAAGLLIEREDHVQERGMEPLARLLASRFVNSAFHGTRLDKDHIAEVMKDFIDEAVQSAGVDNQSFAADAMFMSHETYTPAKGGSAAAEIESLRHAFGESASQIVITNTKGFTGHPMGAGIEDTVALKALQYGRVPPIPNLKEPDPDLGDLTLSKGGRLPVRYAIRLAAGFGSQLALLGWEKMADGDRRIVDEARHSSWLEEVSGLARPELVVEHRMLRLVEADANPKNAPAPTVPPPPPAVTPPPPPAVTPPPPPATPPSSAATESAVPAPESNLQEASSRKEEGVPDRESVLQALLVVVADKTGYGVEELETDYELEADLGIDTVKQAEIFGEVRESYGLGPDPDFKLADYPTIEKLAAWLLEKVQDAEASPTEAAGDQKPSPASGAQAPEDPADPDEEAAFLAQMKELFG
ncbi:MAG: beta-ketoacyl synthase N-terminal-like domain-containing protein, partial [Myxococcota bacterium]|nr:beta-ketoacyl synthase N-terminal-like domain-containing protein [Myxococcota bacterium]